MKANDKYKTVILPRDKHDNGVLKKREADLNFKNLQYDLNAFKTKYSLFSKFDKTSFAKDEIDVNTFQNTVGNAMIYVQQKKWMAKKGLHDQAINYALNSKMMLKTFKSGTIGAYKTADEPKIKFEKIVGA